MAIGSFRRRGCTCKKKKCTCGAKWYFRFDIGPDPKTGERRQREKGGFATKAEAEAAAKQIHTELIQGNFVEGKDITFDEFSKTWLETYQLSGKVKPSTIRARSFALKKLKCYLARIKMKDITTGMYQNILNALKFAGSADSSLSGIHATGSMIFKKAVEKGIIKRDPTEYAELPKTQQTVEELEREEKLPKFLEKNELRTFLKTAIEDGLDRDYPIFITLAYTGMRVGELCALKWKDIDFNEHTISITKTVYHGDGNVKDYKLLTPKTIKSIRIIEVESAVIAELDKHRSWQKLIRMKHRNKYYDNDFVFANASRYPGYPEISINVRDRMKRLLKLSNLNESLTPHSLRHTHTSLLAEAGVALETIMDRLGHNNDSVTKSVYLHVTKSKKKEASQKFAELMRSL
ncbi:tyrosine-type recombinase/integrase [Paenibacillus oryzisoli]|uniref:Integrase n=1 Tax=Paenibacillus oryzisoli TaxID=1850517 RepID=A0A198A7K8_9BACL|nr:tyrosine-type recombinase/integrase [Paenibacillus oryzisoli]OAS17459.1 integrase [Paenibacillus oryzisoli]